MVLFSARPFIPDLSEATISAYADLHGEPGLWVVTRCPFAWASTVGSIREVGREGDTKFVQWKVLRVR